MVDKALYSCAKLNGLVANKNRPLAIKIGIQRRVVNDER